MSEKKIEARYGLAEELQASTRYMMSDQYAYLTFDFRRLIVSKEVYCFTESEVND